MGGRTKRGSRASAVCFYIFLAIGLGIMALLRREVFGFQAWMLLWLAPAACFGLLWALSRKGRMAASTASQGAVDIVVLCLLVVPIALIFSGMMAATTPTDNPAHYAQARGLCGTAIDSFPADVPEGAENVDFWYNAPFLQGGGRLMLAYDGGDPSALSAAAEGAVWSGPMADALEACPPLSWESLSLSDAAVIHVLQCRPGSDGTWNHGLFALAARDGARTLFLYENW